MTQGGNDNPYFNIRKNNIFNIFVRMTSVPTIARALLAKLRAAKREIPPYDRILCISTSQL